MKSVRCFLLPLIMVAAGSLSLSAQPDTSRPALFSMPVIMYVGHFNPDCVEDTLVGFYQNDLKVRPAYLLWGKLYDSTGSPICDSARYDRRLRTERVRDTTRIEYPTWGDLQVNVAILRYNTNDTLSDLLFWTRGKARAVRTRQGLELRDSSELRQGDSVVFVDTARSLVIFGQIGLSTLQELKLKQVRGAQSTPFAAMQLGYAVDLVEPKQREHSGRTSWKLRKVSQVVDSTGREDTTTSPPPSALSSVSEPGITARIYPNPAIYSANVDVRPLPAGTYIVELVAADGDVVSSYHLELSREGSALETLDLSMLPSGHYFVRIRTDDRSYGDYPVIIVR